MKGQIAAVMQAGKKSSFPLLLQYYHEFSFLAVGWFQQGLTVGSTLWLLDILFREYYQQTRDKIHQDHSVSRTFILKLSGESLKLQIKNVSNYLLAFSQLQINKYLTKSNIVVVQKKPNVSVNNVKICQRGQDQHQVNRIQTDEV